VWATVAVAKLLRDSLDSRSKERRRQRADGRRSNPSSDGDSTPKASD
jgi:hypothetical protein